MFIVYCLLIIVYWLLFRVYCLLIIVLRMNLFFIFNLLNKKVELHSSLLIIYFLLLFFYDLRRFDFRNGNKIWYNIRPSCFNACVVTQCLRPAKELAMLFFFTRIFSQISTLVCWVAISSSMIRCFSVSVKYLPAFWIIFLSMFYSS